MSPSKATAAENKSSGGDESPSSDEVAPKDAAPSEDWTKMKWPDARKYIAKISGTFPRNKAHAEELMSE